MFCPRCDIGNHHVPTTNQGRSTACSLVTHTPCRSAMEPGVTTLHSAAEVPGSPSPRAIAARPATAAAPSSPSSTAPGARGAAAVPASGTDACARSCQDAVRAAAGPAHSWAPGCGPTNVLQPAAVPYFDAAECPNLLLSGHNAGSLTVLHEAPPSHRRQASPSTNPDDDDDIKSVCGQLAWQLT